MSGSLDRLLELQEHDTRLDQLRHRRSHLAQRAELDELESHLRQLDVSTEAVQAERRAHAVRQAELEEQIENSKRRRSEIEKRMFASNAASRDLQAMDEETRHLARHISELEDREIEVMEVLEPLDKTLAGHGSQRAGIDARVLILLGEIGVAEEQLDAEIADELEVRGALSAELPEALLVKYESLRAKLGGTGAARLVGGSCAGCHLALPAMEVDRIKKAPDDAVVTCDNCGRILVR